MLIFRERERDIVEAYLNLYCFHINYLHQVINKTYFIHIYRLFTTYSFKFTGKNDYKYIINAFLKRNPIFTRITQYKQV